MKLQEIIRELDPAVGLVSVVTGERFDCNTLLPIAVADTHDYFADGEGIHEIVSPSERVLVYRFDFGEEQ